MIIDCHAHLMPQSWFHPKSPKSIFDLDGLFKEQDEAGVDITVFGNNWIRSPDGADPLRVVQEFNAHAAELTAKHPKRLLGLACSVPYDNDKILKETEKAIREYKLKGIMIGSSTNGEYLEFVRQGAKPPFFWTERKGQYFWRGMWEEVPLPLDWPVYCTHEEAAAYAQWRGMRLPSEPEFHRAA